MPITEINWDDELTSSPLSATITVPGPGVVGVALGAVAPPSSGEFWAVIFNSTSQVATFNQYDESGNVLATFDKADQQVNSIAVGSDGIYYMYQETTGLFQGFITKVDFAGNEIWSVLMSDAAENPAYTSLSGYRARLSPDETKLTWGVELFSPVVPPQGERTTWTVDPTDGSTINLADGVGEAGDTGGPLAAQIDENYNTYFCGFVTPMGSDIPILVKFDNTGALVYNVQTALQFNGAGITPTHLISISGNPFTSIPYTAQYQTFLLADGSLVGNIDTGITIDAANSEIVLDAIQAQNGTIYWCVPSYLSSLLTFYKTSSDGLTTTLLFTIPFDPTGLDSLVMSAF